MCKKIRRDITIKVQLPSMLVIKALFGEICTAESDKEIWMASQARRSILEAGVKGSPPSTGAVAGTKHTQTQLSAPISKDNMEVWKW